MANLIFELARSARHPRILGRAGAVFSRLLAPFPRGLASSVAFIPGESVGEANCLDCGDWIVVVFLFAFAGIGARYLFEHPSDGNFLAWLGILGVCGGIFHWIRVHDQKVQDAQ